MTKIENEREMIAKFMGWISDEDGDGWWRIVSNTYKVPVHDEMMMFDQSWEALMQVVDKIELIQLDTPICLFSVHMDMNRCQIIPHPQWDWNGDLFKDEIIFEEKTKKESTYKTVVQFIKWYNETINRYIK